MTQDDKTPAQNDSEPELQSDDSVSDVQMNKDTPSTVAVDEETADGDVQDSPQQPDTAGEINIATTARKKFPWGSLALWLALVLLGAAVAAMGWYGYQFYREDASKSGRVSELQGELTSLSEQQQQLAASRQQQQAQLQTTQQQLHDANERILAAEQRLAAQNKRLLAMSTITREDWLLAEAEYLLKLANQRILIERSAGGAEALLTEADKILRDLDDPDLFALRKAVNNDLASLRLVQKIDAEGIYLQINGLVEQITTLPIRPDRKQVLGINEKPVSQKLDSELTAENWWEAIKNNMRAFLASLRSYISIDRHGEKPTPILAPESAQYLQQNVRLMMERAQLALLREQQAIYQNSLLQAEKYLSDYYPKSAPVAAFREQLQALSQKNIEVKLPDITGSLELLHAYIEALHNLKGAEPAVPAGGASQ